ncbi:cell wall hydrolase [Calidifontibacillus erzurumensis]|uniref:Cell wall hydrolase n=1 Tax=Calidifontibacillus erzurumensis TaxID=2741433 RepID=A0A8J8GCJ8_9BACI|nr:stalk domain-containing protein [Calidifontibacillus erzurumensis]NSL50651.1 cell wall hydrolase [Calidifontibacillus erzurumensis]
MKRIISLFFFMGLIILFPNQSNADQTFQLYVNDQLVSLQEPLFVENERVFVPVRFVGEQLGAAVEWKREKQTVLIRSPIEDQVQFYVQSRRITLNGSEYIMDVEPIIRNGRMYLPIRHVAEMLHLQVKWLKNSQIIYLQSYPLYEVQPGDTLLSISNKFQLSVELLKERNQLTGNSIEAGSYLKVIVPHIIKHQTNDDLILLAKLIEAEAESEPFLGKVAIGNVIVNRVKDDRFPNSIKDVILEQGQFTPVSTGRINKVKPSNSSIDAAKKAIAGEKPVKDAIYFFNRANTTNAFLLAREVVTDIGNHRFTR